MTYKIIKFNSENTYHIILQFNKHAKHADILKTKSGDLKNNVFTTKITLDNLRKDIEGIYHNLICHLNLF